MTVNVFRTPLKNGPEYECIQSQKEVAVKIDDRLNAQPLKEENQNAVAHHALALTQTVELLAAQTPWPTPSRLSTVF